MLSVKVFVYGKLPQEGDYIFRGDDYKIYDILEKWSNQYVSRLPFIFPVYKEYWLSAPIWSFCTPQRFFNSYAFGFLINSCDRVQREYPLIVLFLFSNKSDMLIFLKKRSFLLKVISNYYTKLTIDGFLLKINEVIEANYIEQDSLFHIDNELIEKTLSLQKSLWWAKGRNDTFIVQYDAFPLAEDLILYYGL